MMPIEKLLAEAKLPTDDIEAAYTKRAVAKESLFESVPELVALVKAARRHCIKRMLPDDHELREALAALDRHEAFKEGGK